MMEQTEIIELTHLSCIEILQQLKQIVRDSEFQRFTVFLKRKQKSKRCKKQKFKSKFNIYKSISLDDNSNKILQPKAETIKQSEDLLVIKQFSLCKTNDNISTKTSQFFKHTLQIPIANRSEFVQVSKALQYYDLAEYQNAIDTLKSIQKDIQYDINKNDKLKLQSDIDKKHSQVSFHLGNCYFRTKQYEKAIIYYQMEFSYENQRQKGQRMNNLGSCYATLKQTQLSLRAFSNALKIYQKFRDIDCSNLLNNIGIIYLKSGMHQTAVQYFQDSIKQRKIKSSHNIQMLYHSYYKMGIALKLSQRYEQSLNCFLLTINYAQRGGGNYENVLKQLALVYQLLQKWDEALSCYERLSDNFTQQQLNQGYIYERVAYLHRRLGNNKQFQKFINIALKQYRLADNVKKISQLSNFQQKNA